MHGEVTAGSRSTFKDVERSPPLPYPEVAHLDPWDDANASVGADMLAYWKDKLGSSWDPLRDLWARHA
jgi:hypothetical protein